MGLLGDETKYGNRDSEHQTRSYSTWMGYEIMDSVEDSVIEEDVVEVIRCKDCKMEYGCRVTQWLGENGFCSYGERKDN